MKTRGVLTTDFGWHGWENTARPQSDVDTLQCGKKAPGRSVAEPQPKSGRRESSFAPADVETLDTLEAAAKRGLEWLFSYASMHANRSISWASNRVSPAQAHIITFCPPERRPFVVLPVEKNFGSRFFRSGFRRGADIGGVGGGINGCPFSSALQDGFTLLAWFQPQYGWLMSVVASRQGAEAREKAKG